MPRKKKEEIVEKKEEVVVEQQKEEKTEQNVELKEYVVSTKFGYALNVRNRETNDVVRTIANGTPITVIEIKDGKAILNDNEYVVSDLIKEVG